ncbi:MAG: metallophosphoesterase [Lachnospiraceae bacterium]|nr:metallophosphoesterase [Lachnospiraceae bacterium]
MKVAVLSDIHANQVALSACLDYLNQRKKNGQEAVAATILLGDYISDCPYPQRTMELLEKWSQSCPCYWIRGNREEYLLAYQDSPNKNWEESSSTGSLLYTYNNLSRKELDFFRSMPNTDTIAWEGYEPLCICHGSPRNVREELHPDSENAKECLKEIQESYLISGHTHTQCEVFYQGKTLWNPGALGIPFGVKGKTIFSILTAKAGGWDCEWITIPYDIEAELKQFEESGLNRMARVYALTIRLSLITGKNVLLETVELAKRMAEQDGIKMQQFGFPEKYWEKAARILKIL